MMYGDNVYKYISKSYMVNNPFPNFVSLLFFKFLLKLNYLKMVYKGSVDLSLYLETIVFNSIHYQEPVLLNKKGTELVYSGADVTRFVPCSCSYLTWNRLLRTSCALGPLYPLSTDQEPCWETCVLLSWKTHFDNNVFTAYVGFEVYYKLEHRFNSTLANITEPNMFYGFTYVDSYFKNL